MGTTSEKLTYLNTTKTLIKEELNLGGANITNEPFRAYKDKLEGIYKDFLANGTDTLWNNWLPKINGTGETITLNNTIEAKMDFVYKGNTYQYSTTGKNLINDYDLINRYNIASISDNIITTNALNSNYTVFQPRTKTQKIDLVENTKYYVSFDCRLKSGTYSAKLGASIINGIDGTSYSTGNTAISNPNMSSSYQRYSFECISNITTNSILGFSIQVQQGLSNAVFEIKNIMISTSSDTTYEPYTNGASPNPDYPQDIQVVSGDNTIKVEGANLVSSYRNATGTGQFWAALYVKANLKPNAFYEVSFIDNSTGNDYTRNESLAASVSSYSIISNGERQYYSFKTKDNISPDGNGEYLIFKNNKAQSQAPQFTNVDIREVAQLTTESFDYEPYQSQSYAVNLGDIELCKIGDYQDRIYKDNGKWYLNKQIGKVVLDGSENWNLDSVYNNINQYSMAKPDAYQSNDNVTRIISNHFKGYQYRYSWTIDNSITISGAHNIGRIRAMTSKYTTVNDFKTWLSTNNTTCYYVLATPTTTEITDTTLIIQLEAIKKSYNTQTNISQTNADKPFILDVVALGN